VVELVLKRCLGHRDGETVCIVTDSATADLGRIFYDTASRMGIETTFVTMSPREAHGEEPPPSVAAALERVDVAVALTSMSLTHTLARRRATKRRVRIASMPGADGERLEWLLDIDYADLGARCWRVAELLGRAKRLRIVTGAGTDLSCSIEGRSPFLDTGVYETEGAFGNLPAGEVCVSPVEGTAEGVLVVDGSLAGLGRLPEPLRLTGGVGGVTGPVPPALGAMLERAGPAAFVIGEVGIGLNPHAEVVGNVLEDEKAIGTVHVALGDNLSFGGTNRVSLHLDGVLLRPRVYVDDREADASALGWEAAPPAAPGAEIPLGPPKPIGPGDAEAYRLLFENANDAQYVLDLASQQFIEANPRFEQLTGYTREELLHPSMRVGKLIARESQTAYQRKFVDRRTVSSERYELRMLCKSGEKRPVEISVKKIRLVGREVIIGSVRDLTERKRFEQELWQKIEDLGTANSRVYALTEKIKAVPALATQLLNVADEEELLARAAKHLCDRQGLACQQVDFWLVKGDALELRTSTHTRGPRRHALDSVHRLVQVLKTGVAELSARGAALPLKGRDRALGVMAVDFDRKEIELLTDNAQALKGYQDILVTLSNVLGLLADNLRLYEAVRVQSTVDALTGAYNRRTFDGRVTDEIHRARRYDRPLSLLMIDLDNFKAINDTRGHKQGDSVLAEAARIFRRNTRDVDYVCRYGGDEFAVLLPETAKENAAAKAEQLLAEVRKHPFANVDDAARPLSLTLSVGVAAYRTEDKSDDDLLRRADEALYTAKREGRNRVSVI
jgi:diguanylate cyclase (GGDEF)-like protein/PAS domain S-box-containing protein